MGTVKNIFHRTGKLLTRRLGPGNSSGVPDPASGTGLSMPLAKPERMEACLVHVEGAFDDTRAQAGAYRRRSHRYRMLARLARLCRMAVLAR